MMTVLVGLSGTLLGALITLAGQWFLASRQQKNLFRLAALDKRLAVHQEAFARWRKLVSVTTNKEERTDVVLDCQEWWYNNCLYLDPTVRDAFRLCFDSVWDFEHMDTEERRKKLWGQIMAPGNLIQETVNLPSFSDVDGVAKGLGPETGK